MNKILLPLLFAVSAVPVSGQTGTTQTYKNAILVTASDYASAAGRDILKKGGNAFDAAVTVSFVLAVTHPSAGNIAGGGFMVARLSDGQSISLDFREKAPAKASPEAFLDPSGAIDQDAALKNHRSAGVPGSVDGMLKIVERFGRLPLDVLLAPAIKLAKTGFVLRYEEALLLNRYKDDFSRWPGSAVFLKPGGAPWEPGDVLVQPDLARTLERIAKNGRNGFYAGETAEKLVSDMRSNGGFVDLTDLKNYRAEWREPIRFSAFGYDFATMGPPSAGGITLLQMLKMMESRRIDTLRYNAVEAIHLYAETARRAYADRNHFLGDPSFVANPLVEMSAAPYLANRMSSFDPLQATSSAAIAHGDIPGFSEPTETTHYSIVDKEGNAVAVTTSLNASFGNKIVVPGTGMLLNNHMDDFSLKPGEPNMYGLVSSRTNAVKPGKRMLSSMTPTIVSKDGKTVLVLGASGGSTITTTVAQIFIYTRLFGMNLQQAVSAPRIHHQWLPDQIFIDPFGIDEATRSALEAKGHKLFFRTAYIGRSENILIDENGLHAAADPRGSDSITGF